MFASDKVLKALKHVRSFFPSVDTVFYGIDHGWLYCEGTNVVKFHKKDIDIDCLVEAAESVKEFPAAFTMPLMKSIILYASNKYETAAEYADICVDTQSDIVVCVRAELFYGDMQEALDNAKPRKDETVLNTIPYDPK